MKKVIILSLLIIVALILVGCGNQDTFAGQAVTIAILLVLLLVIVQQVAMIQTKGHKLEELVESMKM